MSKLTKDQKRKKKLTIKKKQNITKQQQLKSTKNQPPSLPPFITCNECGGLAPQETFEILNTKGMEGINLALSGVCEDCNAPTIAISGDPNATTNLMSIMQEEMGGNIGADMFK